MRSTRWTGHVLLLFAVAGCAVAGRTGSEATGSPKATLTAWADSLRLSDVDGMLAFYENSDEVAAFESYGRVRRGTSGIREMYEDAFGAVEFRRAWMDSLRVRQSGNVAWATCNLNSDTVLKADGAPWKLQIHGSFVLKKNGPSWRIVLGHFSSREGIPRVSPG
ncbi:MAG: YybH family protein [Planctomycetota bacterium]